MASDVKAMTQGGEPAGNRCGEGDQQRYGPQGASNGERTMDDVGHDAVSAQDHVLSRRAAPSSTATCCRSSAWRSPRSCRLSADRCLSAAIGASVLVGIFVGTITGLPYRRHRSQEDVHHRFGGDRAVLASERIRCRGLAARGRPGSSSACSSAPTIPSPRRSSLSSRPRASVDLHGNGVGGVVSGRHRSRRGGLRALHGVEETGWKWMLGSAVVLLRGSPRRTARYSLESPLVAGEQGGAMPGAGRDGSRVRLRIGACARKADGQDAAGDAFAWRVPQAHDLPRGAHPVPGGAHVRHLTPSVPRS